MVNNSSNILEIGDEIAIIIKFKYYHHVQIDKRKKCELSINEISNQKIIDFINNKLLKIINKWISNLYYGTISNKTKKIKIPSVELKFTKSNIKKIDIKKNDFNFNKKLRDKDSSNGCYYKNSKDVNILLVSKLKKSSLKLDKLVTELDIPSLQVIDNVDDKPKAFFNIIKDAIYHYSSSAGILDTQERHNLIVDNIGFKALKYDKILF
jgi:type II secretory pathway component GspD/PulD (secretin)